MSEVALHRVLSFVVIGIGLAVFVALWFVTAPYGRHVRRGWGPAIASRWGWMLMESPSAVGFLLLYLGGAKRAELVPLVFLALWEAHYLHRTFIYPLRLKEAQRRMPYVIVLLALLFNALNTYLNARQISELGVYPLLWLIDPRFVVGALMFVAGFAVNQQADAVLLGLRDGKDGGYQIPHGGLYRLVSCPNYLGELIEWAGFAIATWSCAGAAFAIFTAANLVPRAVANHRWYRRTFPDYPAGRRAILPYIL
ncbi:MAG: DUF1295 domain-containing protein [Deltaproteobacteria bacterium]|nr:DUF1295 domain-containing protein [Deltaproteobacteria bacterium]